MEIIVENKAQVNEQQLNYIRDYCSSFTFDWVKDCEEMHIYISPYKGKPLGGWMPDLEVLCEGNGDSGSGYFGFHINKSDCIDREDC